MDKFNTDEFFKFLDNNFYGFNNAFLRETIKNIIDYAIENKSHTLDEVCYFLSDMLPDVSFEDVIMFANDSILTEGSIKIKNNFIKETNLKNKILNFLDRQNDKFIIIDQLTFLENDVREIRETVYMLIAEGILKKRDCAGEAFERVEW